MSKETLPPDLVRSVTRFGKKLRARFAPINRPTAGRIARLLARVLVPHRKRGRKPTPEVLAAIRMRARKAAWPQVYAAVLPDYAKLHRCDRILESRKLRRNVAAFLKRRGAHRR